MSQTMKPSISPYALQFVSTPLWIQLHDMLADWRCESIVHRSASKVGSVVDIDMFSLGSEFAKVVGI